MNTAKIVLVSLVSSIAGSIFTLYCVSTGAWSLGKATQHDKAQWASHTHIAEYDPLDGAASTQTPLPEEGTDLSRAAARAIPSVVYINAISRSGVSYSYWDMLFNNSPRQRVSSGSGVIFGADGYILTNNHVVEAAEAIKVIYQKKSYDATLVGADPSTDLAVLKIEEENLPSISLGNSDKINVGEWVIAVGNPLSLSSTVTAGIVSAKGRRINIVEGKFPIESFIQTDAAINPGNSGGALVDKNGDLVGINTAIISQTGSYTGYAFAVPVNIAKKVFSDIVKYGLVQKAFFGADVEEYDFENTAKYNLVSAPKIFKGVLLARVDHEGAAGRAGLSSGDVIVALGGVRINSKSEFEEELSYRSPGEKVEVSFVRNGKEKTASVALVNSRGEPSLIRRELYEDGGLGVLMESVEYGIKALKVREGGLFHRLGIPENYTIVSINGRKMKSPSEVSEFFGQHKGRVEIYGFTSAREAAPLAFYLR